jgi:four helix bundle protein
MSEYKDFEEMEVWRDAQDLAEQVYRDFLSVKDYSFCDQIKRAAVSISNNIAEGSERTTPADFSRFLDIAKGLSGEVRSAYRLAVRLGFVPTNISDIRSEKCKSISRQLGGLQNSFVANNSPSTICHQSSAILFPCLPPSSSAQMPVCP